MATQNAVHPKPSTKTYATVDISTDASGLSDIVSLSGLTLSSIQISTAWTTARIGFFGNFDGSTNFFEVYSSAGTRLTHLVSANRMQSFDPLLYAPFERLQIVSELADGTRVAQAAVRTLVLGLAEVVKCD